jgi:hypothetical protein
VCGQLKRKKDFVAIRLTSAEDPSTSSSHRHTSRSPTSSHHWNLVCLTNLTRRYAFSSLISTCVGLMSNRPCRIEREVVQYGEVGELVPREEQDLGAASRDWEPCAKVVKERFLGGDRGRLRRSRGSHPRRFCGWGSGSGWEGRGRWSTGSTSLSQEKSPTNRKLPFNRLANNPRYLPDTPERNEYRGFPPNEKPEKNRASTRNENANAQ